MVDCCNGTLNDALSWATSISRTRLTTVDNLSLAASSSSTAISDLQGILRTVAALKLKKIPYDELQENDYVGQGETFSVVKHNYGENVVAVKFIKRDIVNGAMSQSLLRKRLQAVLREIEILQHGPIKTHPNIIHLMGFGWKLESGKPYPYIVAEYGSLGSMRPFLKANAGISLPDRLLLAGDIAAGLTALHDVEVIHGDLKLDNVIVFPTWDRASGYKAKLCDFGHSILLVNEEPQPYYYGTPIYLPPEALRQKINPISHEDLHKCDIWTFGLALWEILKCGETYFQSEWLSSSEYSLPSTSMVSFSSTEPREAESSEEDSSGLGAAAHAIPEYTKYFGTFDLNRLQELSQQAVKRACPARNFQRSYLGPLLKWTLHPEPDKRASRLSKFPIMIDWASQAPSNSLNAKLAIHARTAGIGYDMFRPERQEDIPWEHQLEIFKDFLNVASAERPGPKLASVCFQLMICYVLGFGCKIDYSLANQNLRRAVENEMNIARIFQDELAAALTGLTLIKTTTTFASKLRSSLSSQRTLDKTSTLHLRYMDIGDQASPGPTIYLSAYAPASELLASAVAKVDSSQDIILTQTKLFTDNRQLSWLEYAILTDDIQLFRLYCKATVSTALSLVGPFGEEPIALACKLGRSYMVRVLLSLGLDARPIVHWLFCLGEDAAGCLQLALDRNPSLATSINHLYHETFVIDPQWPTELGGTPLAFAVITGSRNLVKRLLSMGADPVAPALPPHDDGMESEWTAVHLAVKYNHVEILKDMLYQLNNGPDLQFPMLQLASALSFLTPVERFAIHGSTATQRLHDTLSALPLASLFWPSSAGATPVLQAIDFENVETTEALLARQPRLAEAIIANPKSASSRMLPLHFAAQICARRGSSDAQTIPRAILKAFPEAPFAVDEAGLTPLHFAAAANFAEVTRLLISEGSQVNAVDKLGRPPLMLCRSAANALQLLQEGADVQLVDGNGLNAAHHAVVKGDEAQLRLLIDNGVSIQHIDHDVGTPLHYAVSRSSRTHIELLLEAGASVNVPNVHGDTALHIAIRTGRSDAVHLLGQHHADPAARNNARLTPLTLAIKTMSRSLDISSTVSMPLLSKLIEMTSDSPGREEGPLKLVEGLHACAGEGNEELMNLLLRHERVEGFVSANALWKGRSPLHVAAVYGWDGTAKALLEAGADPNIQDTQGETPLIALCASEHILGNRIEFADLLRRGGADLTYETLQRLTAWSIAHSQEDYEMMTFLLSNSSPVGTGNAPVTLKMVNWAISNGYIDFVEGCLRHASTCLEFMFEPLHFARMAEAFKDSRKQIEVNADRLTDGNPEQLIPTSGDYVHMTPEGMVAQLRGLLSYDPEQARKAINGARFTRPTRSHSSKIADDWRRVGYF
ncbi:hypothetical protein LTS15_010158 [Exophiala xenobiotica]|nr:hypothetical protein LTS15_010158 [Exophiala xenobiotica]